MSAAFFDHNRNKIIDYLTFSPKIVSYIENKYKNILTKNTVAVHIRRGDYIRLIKENRKKKWCLLGKDYYMEAFKKFDKSYTFVFFKEDDESGQWIKSNLVDMVEDYVIIENEPSPVDMCFMSMCKNNIIANSTFSYWGAYLNKNQNKKVIAPSSWKIGDIEGSMKRRAPSDWIIVDCECHSKVI